MEAQTVDLKMHRFQKKGSIHKSKCCQKQYCQTRLITQSGNHNGFDGVQTVFSFIKNDACR